MLTVKIQFLSHFEIIIFLITTVTHYAMGVQLKAHPCCLTETCAL
jgi:hypothetical protein